MSIHVHLQYCAIYRLQLGYPLATMQEFPDIMLDVDALQSLVEQESCYANDSHKGTHLPLELGLVKE